MPRGSDPDAPNRNPPATVGSLERALGAAGSEAVEVAPRDDGARIVDRWDDQRSIGEFLVAGRITARGPAARAER